MYQFTITLTPSKGRYIVDVEADDNPDDEFDSGMCIDQFEIPRYGKSGGDPFGEWVRALGRMHRARDEREWHGA